MVVEPGEGGGCEEEQHTALSFTADPRRGSKRGEDKKIRIKGVG